MGNQEHMTKRINLILLALLITLLAACKPDAQNSGFRIRVIVDGKELVFSATERNSVGQFLQQTNVTLGELDRVNPPEFTQITDNMVITIVRVRDDTVCNDEIVPYETTYLTNPDLDPG